MKKVILLLICLALLTSCKSDDTMSTTDTWNLVNISGGFAGIDKNFNTGEIIWAFNEQNSTLIIEKNTQEPFIGIDEGTYSYAIENINGTSYLNLDNIERGSYTISQDQIIIDENKSSTGSGADRYVFKLEK
jgi:uncharacterized protein YcfL